MSERSSESASESGGGGASVASSEGRDGGGAAEALALKEEGNALYREGDARGAVAKYSAALALSAREPTILANRAAAYLKLEEFEAALADCEAAIDLDGNYARAYSRGGACAMKLGRWEDAIRLFTQAMLRDPRDEDLRAKLNLARLAERRMAAAATLVDEAEAAREASGRKLARLLGCKGVDGEAGGAGGGGGGDGAGGGGGGGGDGEEGEVEVDDDAGDDEDAEEASWVPPEGEGEEVEARVGDCGKASFERAQRLLRLATSEGAMSFAGQLLQLRVQLGLGKEEEVVTETQAMLPRHPKSTPLLRIRARALALSGNLASAARHLQEALRRDPDAGAVKDALRSVKRLERLKEQGNASFRDGDAENAVSAYSRAIALDPLNRALVSTLLANRAAARMRQGRYRAAARDCSRSLERNEAYTKARLRRAECLRKVGTKRCVEQALRDLETAKTAMGPERARDAGLAEQIRATKRELKAAKRKDLYKTLGVDRSAGETAIKKAFRKLSLRLHPDKQAGKTDAERAKAERKFKEASEAYSILSNPEKRRKYDAGVPVEDIDDDHHSGMGGMGGMGGMPGGVPMDVFEAMFGGGGGGFGGGGFGGGFPQQGGGGGGRYRRQRRY